MIFRIVRISFPPLSAIVCLMACVGLPACVSAVELNPAEIEFFEQRIRPVLVEHCYECHNSAETSEADLSLDHRAAVRRGGRSGSVVAGSPEESLLLRVIRHEVDGVEMPEGGPKLSDDVIADFQKWLSMGAPDPRDEPPTAKALAESTSWETIREKRRQWWSFQRIVRPKVPQRTSENQSNKPIDRFIRAKLDDAGLRPARGADRATLARRLSFALVGLPPSPDEVSRYVNDPSDDAYERYVDRLLDSNQFGERWARHWMDWIRYAESHGSEGDPAIVGAHYYRDHVIRSLNADVSYEQMVREHIAGDLLSSPRINHELGINESQVATAHWRMVFHGFTPTDAMEEKVRFTDDAIDVFSKAFLGLTVSCARCHNHKFDAISQADYYALFGIIGSSRPGRAAIDTPERLSIHRAELQKLKADIKNAITNDWKDSFRIKPPDDAKADELSVFIENLKLAGDFPSVLEKEVRRSNRDEDRDDVIHGWSVTGAAYGHDWFNYGVGSASSVSPAGSFAIHPSGDQAIRGVYPAGVYSHLISDKHNAVIASQPLHLSDEYDLWLSINGEGSAVSRYVVQDFPRRGTVYPLTELKNQGWRWQKYDLAYWKGDNIHVELTTANDSAVEVKHQERSWFGIREAIVLPKGVSPVGQNKSDWLIPIRDSLESNPSSSFEEFTGVITVAVNDAVNAWRTDAMTDQQALLLDRCIAEGLLPNSIEALPTARVLIQRYRELESEIPVARRAPALAEWRGADQPLLIRGDHNQPGERIPRRFLEAIDPSPYDAALSGRRELSEDVLREDNPLTARVIVNRIWHHLFGRGIVATTNNFGRLGVAPTHPDLLDFLADEFRSTDAWSIKSMIRRIVTSQTWQQASTPSEMARQVDPDNHLYSYYSVRRLEAEAIRDALLTVSGQLDTAMFGESVPGGSNRRSVYVKVIRNQLDPFLTTFDAPVPFSSKGRRDVTNVPAQALMMMNDPQVTQLARRFADRTMADTTLGDDDARIDWMWRKAFGRRPTESERQSANSYLADSASRYERIHAESGVMAREIDRLKEIEEELISDAKKRVDPKEKRTVPMLDLNPVARWRFDDLSVDGVEENPLKLHGKARLDEGALVLDGESWATTGPLNSSLSGKTLDVLVQLDDLNQSGGGVMTVQNLRGSVFDSIVFAERRPMRWLAGSNNHRRTQLFQGDAEKEAGTRPVRLTITYDLNGNVTCYRDGQPYGNSYQTGLQAFDAGKFEIVFGMRHGKTASGNRMLRGRVFEAHLFDRELTSEEVAAVAGGGANLLSTERIESALSDQERQMLNKTRSQLKSLRSRLTVSQEIGKSNQHWVDFAHSIFNMKEFIYVR